MNYSHEERAEIMDSLSKRLETVERKPRRETRRQKIARERGELPHRPTRFPLGD